MLHVKCMYYMYLCNQSTYSSPFLFENTRKEGVFDDNFSYFSPKLYVVTPHLNRLIETVQMRGHNICFDAELTKIIFNYHQILPLI